MTQRSPIFLVGSDGALVRMTPSAPATEDELQALIAQYPELIGDGDSALLLIEREHGIPDSQDGAERWSVDHLFVTRNATPVLVEVKRAVDTRLRREVVGQMLDYAANGVTYWPLGTIAERFEATCSQVPIDPVEKLAAFIGQERDPADFWEQVDANFRGGRIKLLFVADQIPSELARIVEFMNDQMTADVRAVELRYFQGPNGVRTLAPRIIGETELSRAQKSGARPRLERMSKEDWLAQYIEPQDPKTVEGAKILLNLMDELGADSGVASTRGSIFFRFSLPSGREIYPLFLVKNGTGQIAFGYVATTAALSSEESRRLFFDRFSAAIGPLSAKFHPKGFPSFPLERLTNRDKREAFKQVLIDFWSASRTEPSSPA